jgi:NitT/TauT family transport system substrate-binding protein
MENGMTKAADFRRFGLLAFAAAVTVGLSAGGAAAQSGKPWRHGIIEPKSDSGILMMASQRKFFDKVGLNVEMVKVKNDQIGLKAALAGELDSYEGGPGGAIVADSRGVDVKVIGCSWLTVPHGIFVHNDINSMAELKGKTIAISAPGSFPDILARAALAKFKVPQDQVKFATVGGDLDRYKALVAGVVQAAVVSGEYLPLAEKQKIKMLVSGREALPDFVRVCSMATAKRLKERPDDAAKFIAGEILALRYAVKNKAETVKVAQEVAGIKPDDPRPAFIFDLAMKQQAIGTEMPIPMDKMAWLQNELIHLGTVKTAMDVNKFVDTKPREAALKLIDKTH